MSKTRFGRWMRWMVANLLVLAAGLIILELLFGGWLRDNQMQRLNLPRNVSLSFNLAGLYDSEDSAAVYVRDKYGFRGSYPAPDRIDILTVGGSTTDQMFVTEGKTWQDVLARQFKAAGMDISVVNAGVNGQTSYGHLKNFDWWFPYVPGLHPRYILFYLGINELYVDELVDYDDLLNEAYTPSIYDRVKENSALYYLYRTLRGTVKAYDARLAHQPFRLSEAELTRQPLLDDHEVFLGDQLAQYEKRLTALMQKTRAMGAAPICVTQSYGLYTTIQGTVYGTAHPVDYRGTKINGVDVYHFMRLINDKTLQVCSRMGGVSIDLAREVDWKDGDFYDTGHNTPKGSDKIGRFLYVKLRPLIE